MKIPEKIFATDCLYTSDNGLRYHGKTGKVFLYEYISGTERNALYMNVGVYDIRTGRQKGTSKDKNTLPVDTIYIGTSKYGPHHGRFFTSSLEDAIALHHKQVINFEKVIQNRIDTMQAKLDKYKKESQKIMDKIMSECPELLI